MLNLTEIAARIHQPELCQVGDIDSLRTLCETYPYSQVFPLLYLKTLAQTNDVRLDLELQKYAYRISDRTILFDLLNKTHTSDPALKASMVASIEQKKEPDALSTIHKDSLETPIEHLSNKRTEEIVPSPVEPNECYDNEVTPVETHIDNSNENLENQDRIPTDELPSLPDDILQSLNIGTEIYSLEREEAKIKAQQKKENVERELEKQRLIEALTQKKSRTEPVTENNKHTSERSFIGWLNYNNSSTKKELTEQPPAKEITDSATTIIGNGTQQSFEKEKLFEDRIEKNELFNPTKKAKESLDETRLPVSETLAKIFAAQGNYPKAIYAYEQLMLIIPEKKVFFASQIEELTKKLNT